MDVVPLLASMRRTFSDAKLFGAHFVNEQRYLSMYRLHARVCGLLARVGVDLGLIPEIGRRYPIEPIVRANGRKQLQAEADVSLVDPATDKPIILLDYETSDAPVFKMRNKFK